LDPLSDQSVDLGIVLGVGVTRYRPPSTSELVCVSLHGDYRYDPLANTVSELQEQEKQLKEALIESLQTQSLIVSGYSGRDKSVMAALQQALKVYWCGHEARPNGSIIELIEKARDANREAFYVPGADFDDIMARLATSCITGDRGVRVFRIIGSAEESQTAQRDAFETFSGLPSHLIKSNAFPLRCPAEMFAFDLEQWPQEHVWKWLADQALPHNVLAVPFKQVLAFGTLDDISAAFAGNIHGSIQRVPISENDYRHEDGAVMSLLLQALVRAIAGKLKLDTDGKRLLWEVDAHKTEQQNGQVYRVHRCIGLGIRQINEKPYLTIDPTFYVPVGVSGNTNDALSVQRKLLGYQHNKQYNDDLNYWRQTLGGNRSEVVFDYPAKSAAFKFYVDLKPVYATICSSRRGISVPPTVEALVHHKGTYIQEPKLLFAATGGWQASSDTMPLRGLASNGPFDLPLSSSPVSESVRVSVISSQAEAGILEQFLNGLNARWQPQRGTREEYLVPYPGFQAAFRIPVELPRRGDVRWITLPELNSSLNERDGALELSQNICGAIQSVASAGRSIVVIFTPTRWNKWRRFEATDERFDVHNFVKAYAVQRGISTQFLTQEKLDTLDKCRYWWWLSVALYAKAMRTPWVLQGLDDNTAYVGLGYAIDTKATVGQHIVLGCSHLYNSHGQGLQFRLSQIENPLIRGRNPYLSFDDARRMGETIRSLYWESHQRLPHRVVIHKLFPFRLEEIKGLRQGLSDVDELELLEINHESRLRYLSSIPTDGGFKEDSYPVRRGTAVRLSDYEALAWIHGATEAIRPNWTYFQGKRRIPGPVVIRRYAGRSTFATLFNEILGLSMMDWNSGDLYSQLPATVQSSRAIAQIGSLLKRFGRESYDYRLFM
jgi:hypothetical protein